MRYSGTPGTHESAMPTRSSAMGSGTPVRRAPARTTAVTMTRATTPVTSATTRRSCHPPAGPARPTIAAMAATRRGRVRVGTSGWTYDHWQGTFFPDGLARRRRLEYLAGRLDTAEINGTFYSLQRASSFRTWAAATPEDFRFAVKGSRYLTHMRKLRDVEEPLGRFLASGLLALGPKLGPILWQLPPNLRWAPDRIEGFLRLLPRSTGEAAALAAGHTDRVPDPCTVTDEDRPLRHALEPRHPSFATPDVVALLRAHDVALVVSDGAGVPCFDDVTADLVYIPLHGPAVP